MAEKPSYPSDAADKFIVRLPVGMRERLAAQAKANNRSMNAEVVDCLQASLDGKPIEAIEHYIRRLQLEMAGMHSELAVFASEARSAAQFLLGLCEDLANTPGPKPAFLATARRVAETVLLSSNRYGEDVDGTLAKMRAKADEIQKGRLYPHEFSDRSVFEWAQDRARDMGLLDESGRVKKGP